MTDWVPQTQDDQLEPPLPPAAGGTWPGPPDGATVERSRRREWVAACRWLADQSRHREAVSADLNEAADLIEAGELTPWADRPPTIGGPDHDGLTGQPGDDGMTESSAHGEGMEPAAEPPGDGPGWERSSITVLIRQLRNAGLSTQQFQAEQVEALLAHFDRMNELTDRQLRDAEGYVRRAEERGEKAEVERDAARAELAANEDSEDARLAIAERERDLAATGRLNGNLIAALNAMSGELVAAHNEQDEYQQVFELGYRRMGEATALWRAEAPKERARIQPDLGALLTWLMQRGATARADLEQLRGHLASCVWVDQDRYSGQPCLGGTRIPVSTVTALMRDGMTADQIRESYLDVTDEHLAAIRTLENWAGGRRCDALCRDIEQDRDRLQRQVDTLLSDVRRPLDDHELCERQLRNAEQRVKFRDGALAKAGDAYDALATEAAQLKAELEQARQEPNVDLDRWTRDAAADALEYAARQAFRMHGPNLDQRVLTAGDLHGLAAKVRSGFRRIPRSSEEVNGDAADDA